MYYFFKMKLNLYSNQINKKKFINKLNKKNKKLFQ